MKIIVITGASEGIGAELALQLAERDKSAVALVLAARNEGQLQQLAEQCGRFGTQTLVVRTDVSEEAQCHRLIALAVDRFGRIDVLVNNAGISGHARFGEVAREDLHWYEDIMRVNLWGSVWCTHAALAHLQKSRGQIIAVSSLTGLVGVPYRTAYCASKFAMTGFFEALRLELRDTGVSVTTVYPGVVDTRIRHRGFNTKGEAAGVSGLKEEGAMPVQTCARLILQGMDRRQREVVMTTKGKLGRFLKLFAPGVVEKIAIAAVKEHPSTP